MKITVSLLVIMVSVTLTVVVVETLQSEWLLEVEAIAMA